MDPKDRIALAGVVATAAVSSLTILISYFRERNQQARDDRLRDEERLREKLAQERERVIVPRVRVDLECRFLGPQQGRYLTEVRIIVDNIGKVRRVYEHIRIRLLGIKADQTLQRWHERDASRTRFPESLLKTDMVPDGDYYFIEPGVQQIFAYVTDVPEDIAFVRAHIELQAKRTEGEDQYESLFTEERVFAIRPINVGSS